MSPAVCLSLNMCTWLLMLQKPAMSDALELELQFRIRWMCMCAGFSAKEILTLNCWVISPSFPQGCFLRKLILLQPSNEVNYIEQGVCCKNQCDQCGWIKGHDFNCALSGRTETGRVPKVIVLHLILFNNNIEGPRISYILYPNSQFSLSLQKLKVLLKQRTN